MASLFDRLCADHAKLMPHVDELRVIADRAAETPREALQDELRREHEFLSAELLPHMDAVQETLYPSFERLMQNRHSMTPMSREHDQIRHLLDTLGQLAGTTGPARTSQGSSWVMEVRRALYRLYALLKVHLAEEEMYAPILDHELTEAQRAAIAEALDARATSRA